MEDTKTYQCKDIPLRLLTTNVYLVRDKYKTKIIWEFQMFHLRCFIYCKTRWPGCLNIPTRLTNNRFNGASSLLPSGVFIWLGSLFSTNQEGDWADSDTHLCCTPVIPHSLPRHTSIPMSPAVLESTTAECLWQGILDKHPVQFWSYLLALSVSVTGVCLFEYGGSNVAKKTVW